MSRVAASKTPAKAKKAGHGLEAGQYRTNGTSLVMVLSVGEIETWTEDARSGESSEVPNDLLAEWKVVDRGK